VGKSEGLKVGHLVEPKEEDRAGLGSTGRLPVPAKLRAIKRRWNAIDTLKDSTDLEVTEPLSREWEKIEVGRQKLKVAWLCKSRRGAVPLVQPDCESCD